MRSAAIGIAAVLTVVLGFGVLSWQARDHILVVGFWFEQVTFDVDGFSPEEWGGPLTTEERALIESTARAELETAFAGLRIRVSDARGARYRVRVVQRLDRHPFSPFRTKLERRGRVALDLVARRPRCCELRSACKLRNLVCARTAGSSGHRRGDRSRHRSRCRPRVCAPVLPGGRRRLHG